MTKKISMSLLGSMCLFVLLFLFSSNVVFADDDNSVVDLINITVPQSCSVEGIIASGGEHTKTVQNNQYYSEIGTTTFKTYCNDSGGYAIYAIGYSNDEYGNTLMKHSTNSSLDFDTGTNTSGNTSDWSMKLSPVAGTYAPTIHSDTNGAFSAYHIVPNTYTKVVSFPSNTDLPATGVNATGSGFTSTYAAWISATQGAGTYTGKVKYTLVHPSTEVPLQPQTTAPGYIGYYPNGGNVEGTMGRQSAADGNPVQLFASNFSREGYGFAGWSDAFDYATNANAHLYGPNEDITVPTGTTANGLSLYAVWIKSAGTMQGWSGCGSMQAATYNNEGDSDESTWSITAGLNNITALTDSRDNDTYAIAKLTDGKCWMIENLRLADKDSNNNDVILSSTNTNNPSLPLTNVYDTNTTSNHLSSTSSKAYNASTAPDGWCTTRSAACDDQSRIRTDNTANRATYTTTTNMTSHAANLYAYGNYYNWYSATAGNGKYANGSGYTTPGDLCPTGWHLPTGTGSGEFGLLSKSLGGYKDGFNVAQAMSSSTSPTVTIMLQRLRHFPNNLLYSGNVSGASIYDRGGSGLFWSSTAYNSNIAFYLLFNSTYVSPGSSTTNYKYHGRTVRCIASS